jgi:phosphate:Na+ symporter
MMPHALAVPIVIGANIGTTSTALLASIPMGLLAKRTAVANLLFNVIGVLLFVPWMGPFGRMMDSLSSHPGESVAFAHLFFNLTNSVLFLVFLKPFESWLVRLVPQQAAKSNATN